MSDISPWVTHKHLTVTKIELVISLPTSTPKWSSSSAPYLTWCRHHLPCPVDSLKYFPNLRFCVAMSTSLVSPSLYQTKLFKDKGSALANCAPAYYTSPGPKQASVNIVELNYTLLSHCQQCYLWWES